MSNYIFPLLGGLLIGLTAVIMLFFNGKIAGISGITKGVFNKNEDISWRLLFLIGLVVGGFFINTLFPSFWAKETEYNLFNMIIAGFLVGFGSALGNGCTSGHGVCGLGRKSVRSLASVLTFISFGMITVFLVKLLGG
ncbi:MAG: YeeE/YedE thiosulfate transporter family protein [Candidatus Sericytochromatia bacterium]